MRYLFGDYELDTENYELRDKGALCQIEPKVFDLLVYLIQQRRHTVPKDMLLAHLWPNQFVSESSLTYSVMAARKAIGDNGQAQRCIKTVHGRGYRFVAPVEERGLAPAGKEPLGSEAGRAVTAPGTTPLLDAKAALPGPLALVDREHEMQVLQNIWRRVQQGCGHMVLLQGEPGMGASRLVRGWQERLAGEAHGWFEVAGRPFAQFLPYGALVAFWHPHRQRRSGDAAPTGMPCLEQSLVVPACHVLQVVPAPAALPNLPLEAAALPLTLSPRQLVQRAFDTFQAWLAHEAQTHPVVLVLDNVQYMDGLTLTCLQLLLETIATLRLLVVLTAPTAFRPAWAQHASVTRLALARFTPDQAGHMVRQFAGGKPLPADVVQILVATTDGLPVWIDMLTRMVLETAVVVERHGRYTRPEPRVPLALPLTFQDALLARLEHLGVAKQVAQLSAVCGQEFPAAWLQAVATVDAEALRQGVAALIDLGLLISSGEPGLTHYAFGHPLVQEALYQSMLPSLRQRVHRQLARALEEQFPAVAQSQPAVVAHHYAAAGLPKEALGLWRKAGQHALAHAAYDVAVEALSRGLDCLKTRLELPVHTQYDLALQSTLSMALEALQDIATPEKELLYVRARELCPPWLDAPQSFYVQQGLWAFVLLRGDYETACELAQQCLAGAQERQHPYQQVVAHTACGTSLGLLGALAPAWEHLERGHALLEGPADATRHAGQALRVQNLASAAVVRWLQGYPEQAAQKMQTALTQAARLAHPLSLALVLTWDAWLQLFRGATQALQTQATALVALARKHGWPHMIAQATMFQGWALSEQGQREAGLTQLRQGALASHASGLLLVRPAYLSLLAAAYGKAGQAEDGLKVLTEAKDWEQRYTPRSYWTAELARLQGELILATDGGAGPTAPAERLAMAEAFFLEALTVAHEQQSRWLELRAAISLGRLWQDRQKSAVAHQRLENLCRWFTAHGEVPELDAATRLLATPG